MEQIIYNNASLVIALIAFFIYLGIFVTPKQMNLAISETKKDIKSDFDKKISDIKKDYVQKEVHDLAINEMKEDLKEVKSDIKDVKNILIKNSKA